MAQVRQDQVFAADADSAPAGTRGLLLDGARRRHSPFMGSLQDRMNRSRPRCVDLVAEEFPAVADRDSGADVSAEREDMKVAIAKEGAAVSEHFGHCEAYAVYSIENKRAVWVEDIANPGHSPGFLPVYLSERSINTVIAGGMGPRAVDLFCQNGIDVVLGVSGPIADAARAFAEGELVGGTSVCTHDQCSGDCGSH